MNHDLPRPLVQKYGGSSLSTPAKLRAVARKILRSAEAGHPVVAVVSAMGDTTSALLDQARQLASSPPRRELDMLLSSGERMSTAFLAMAIEEAGGSALSLSGPQAGILTDDAHTCASIVDVQPRRVLEELARGRIVIVAGFQGVGPHGEVTTLGRGGSDTTAVALAGALDAERCEIYSDVDGVYTADPRIVAEAMHLQQLDSKLMAEYALHGARVLHPECIQLARRHGVVIHARSTFGDTQYTRIGCEADLAFSDGPDAALPVVGVTSRRRRLEVRARPGAEDVWERTRARVPAADELLRTGGGAGEGLLVDLDEVADPEGLTARLREELGSCAELREQLASVSMVTQPESAAALAADARATLGAAEVQTLAVYQRPHSITCAVPGADHDRAIRALHTRFIEEALAVGA